MQWLPISEWVRWFIKGAIKVVHNASWLHYPNKNVFSDRRNLLYDKSTSFRCDGKLFRSSGPAAGNSLSPKVLYVRVTTRVRLTERSRRSRASATRRQSLARYEGEMPDSFIRKGQRKAEFSQEATGCDRKRRHLARNFLTETCVCRLCMTC